MRLDLLAAFNAERAARRPCVVVTRLADGAQRLVRQAEMARDPLAPQIREAMACGQSLVVGEGAGRQFITLALPPPRLAIIGAVHISQALAPMAGIVGFDVTIIDPRTAFATPERFPDVKLVAEWPDVALPAYGLDPYTALAALTHDPKIDEPAVRAALEAGCFYVGALGSSRTHGARVERLKSLGVPAGDIARIHAPIGLGIGAQSPGEIAVAVLAEVIADLRRVGLRHKEGAAA